MSEELKMKEAIASSKKKLSECILIKNSDNLYLIDGGGGLVFKIDLINLVIDRIDSSFPTRNKYHGDVFSHNNNIYHFGGYGLYKTNNALLKYNFNYNNWDEVIVKKEFPLNDGLAHFKTLIWDNKYYVLSGTSTSNQKEKKNNSLIYYDFMTNKWEIAGELNYIFSNFDIITSNKNSFYLFNKNKVSKINILSDKMDIYNLNENFDFLYEGDENNVLYISHYHNESFNLNSLRNEHMEESCKKNEIMFFKNHDSKYNTQRFKHYTISEFVQLKTKQSKNTYTKGQSRNDFLIPFAIVLVVIISNSIYKKLTSKIDKNKIKEWSFEAEKLFFKNIEITIDNNAFLILRLLTNNKEVNSNDIVALLVDNGMSHDYASKIKNKTIEKLNDKFEFIVGVNRVFIETFKSKEDKRIQMVRLISS